jgi:Xaa-Pro aminopeptidase
MTLSLQERERRYKSVREEMAKDNLDVLLVIGRGPTLLADYRYLSGYAIVAPEPHYAVFPREEAEPVFFPAVAGATDGALRVGQRLDGLTWVKTARQYSELAPANNLLIEEIRRFKGAGEIGLVDMNTMPISIYQDLVKDFGAEDIRDGAEAILRARLIKGEEEIECFRKGAKLADDIYLHLKSIARPGLSDWEIYGQVRRMANEGHCEYSFDVLDLRGGNIPYYPLGDVLTDGGRISIEISPAYEGYYAQLRCGVSVSPYTASQRNVISVWEKGYEAAAKALRPGAKSCDVFHAANEAIESGGCKMPGRVGHGLGLGMTEFLVTADDQIVMQPGMVTVLHVRSMGEDGFFVMLGGTFLVTKDGSEALSKVDLT